MKENFLIIGAGKSGLSVAKFLKKKNITPKIIDTRPKKELHSVENLINQDIEYETDLKIFQFKDFNKIYISPGINPILIGHYKNKILSELDLFLNETSKPIISITGTNGKSTVISYLYQIFKKHNLNTPIGGNFGMPMLDLFDQKDETDFFLLELSSFQLEFFSGKKAHHQSKVFAAFLNFSQDHLDRHGCVKNYLAAKSTISKMTLKDDYYFFNLENKETNLLTQAEKVAFKQNKNDPTKVNEKVSKLIAETVLKNFNIPIRKKNFQMEELKFRNQIVKVNSKLTVINDSKSTNPNSTEFSIKKLKKKNSILILGGKKKGCTFNKLFIPNIIKRVYVFGDDYESIAKEINFKNVFVNENLKEVIADIFNYLKTKDSLSNWQILFSPGCASFDQFKDYEDRGRLFDQYIIENSCK